MFETSTIQNRVTDMYKDSDASSQLHAQKNVSWEKHT
ncbi:hypothetical protein GLYMA_14G164501v4 [Glycine max]|nr:hypothetical protein GLYMA_14G164501v4 [Glycine max]KAH1094884.1 hypothetical protein GYH30_040264 [Glycine max]